ncbi:MAG TPA: PfkB family carbohydrate kinase [Lacunisphaera sp.]|jgi:D-beta-D-heptose 7-phosphate kinase/D-beta-D-heptose 1-phosphate adenosyltransferase|nr:PfkB family carbohydrate kinase [Lacunisphaera sp.]
MNSAQLQALTDRLSGKRVLLIGETILDVYVYGHAIGKSAETPTLVAKELETKQSLGGACLVARNLLELGSAVDFITLVGDDAEANVLNEYAHPKLNKILIIDPLRRTTCKKRYWVDGYKLLQFDTLDNKALSEDLQRQTATVIERALLHADVVVVSDYRHGFLARSLIDSIVRLCSEQRKPLFVDSQVSQTQANHTDYRGADVFCLNLKEAQCIDPGFRPERSASAFATLMEKLDTRCVVVKLGADGCLASLRGAIIESPALKISAVDPCGAGDAFLAALCLGDLAQPEETLRLANIWAGLSTLVHGAQPASRPELLKLLAS